MTSRGICEVIRRNYDLLPKPETYLVLSVNSFEGKEFGNAGRLLTCLSECFSFRTIRITLSSIKQVRRHCHRLVREIRLQYIQCGVRNFAHRSAPPIGQVASPNAALSVSPSLQIDATYFIIF